MKTSSSGRDASVTESNPDWLDKRLADVQYLASNEVVVGLPRGEGGGSLTYPNGASVLDVAIWNVFGTRRGIPARDFLAEATRKILSSNVPTSIVKRVTDGSISPEKALKQLAAYAEGEVKRAITDGVYEPNKPITIKRKGSDKPLIDTGKLRQAIVGIVRGRE